MKVEDKTLCLVTGCPRSGTTAMVDLLNCHPQVAITSERYFSAIKRPNFGLKFFSPARLADFRDTDGYPEAMTESVNVDAISKAAQAVVVGDKMPDIGIVAKAAARIGDVKVIAMLREPSSVLRSFEARRKRAAAGQDRLNWPERFDWRQGLHRFNKSMNQLYDLVEADPQERGFELMVVDYAEIFSPQGDTDALFAFLGVDPALARGMDRVQSRFDADRHEENILLRETALQASYGKFRKIHAHAMDHAEGLS